MMEDKDVKIAKNPEEAFWLKIKEESLKRIEGMKHEIVINEEIVKLAERKISEV